LAWLPIPRQQFLKPVLRRIGDAGEDVGQPGLRIDVVELRRQSPWPPPGAAPRSEPANSQDRQWAKEHIYKPRVLGDTPK
jgi:hypothetical protein